MTEDDFEDIGRRVREIARDAVMHVVNEGMVPPGAQQPGLRDADEWLDLYLAARLGGASSKNLRDHLRTSLRLANEVTHGSPNRIVGAVAATQGLVLLVRPLQAVERTSRPLPPGE